MISVVVPVHDVEPFLTECLQSIARQTVRDLEVIVVDDGSTDRSASIASHFAALDERFTLVRQANHGLSHARNTGIRQATGEYLAFVDADDVLPAEAYERLLGALAESGSDFATGNVMRLTEEGLVPAPFLAKAFARSRRRTHVSRFHALLADRTAWNKLFRRSFWDANGLRFPEGRVHEDIPVIIPAHFLAGSVDVVAAPVYHWRRREGSITAGRLKPQVMRDRLSASEAVLAHLDAHGPRRGRRWYQRHIVGDDLRLHLDLLDEADDAYRHEFVERTRALLDGLPDQDFAHLAAIDRLKWHLLRRGLERELADVVAFQHVHGATRPPLRRRGRWYGDYPHADLAPRHVCRLGRPDAELAATATLHTLTVTDGGLRVGVEARLGAFGADDSRVRLALVRRDRLRPLRMRIAPSPVDPSRLTAPGTWELAVRVRAHGLTRHRTRFTLADPDLVGTLRLPAVDDLDRELRCTHDGAVTVTVRDVWARPETQHLAGGRQLEMTGSARLPGGGAGARLEARRRSDGRTVDCRLDAAAGRFNAVVDLAPLFDAPPALGSEADDSADDVWELWVRDGATSAAVGTLRLSADQHDVEPAGAVDALHPFELDVGRR